MYRGLAVAFVALALTPPVGAQTQPSQDPPRIVLMSKAGTQRAVQETFCVSVVIGETGVSRCVDTVDLPPARLSVVRPGETVAIVVRGATTARGVVSIHPLGQPNRVVLTLRVSAPKTTWRVRLRPRAYELDVEIARFETADGRSGDTSATLGVLVDRDRPLRIIPAGARPALAG